MKRLRTFGAFWYDFVVGDDWRIALGVVVAVVAVTLAAHHHINLWWLFPLTTAGLLAASLAAASKPASNPSED